MVLLDYKYSVAEEVLNLHYYSVEILLHVKNHHNIIVLGSS